MVFTAFSRISLFLWLPGVHEAFMLLQEPQPATNSPEYSCSLQVIVCYSSALLIPVFPEVLRIRSDLAVQLGNRLVTWVSPSGVFCQMVSIKVREHQWSVSARQASSCPQLVGDFLIYCHSLNMWYCAFLLWLDTISFVLPRIFWILQLKQLTLSVHTSPAPQFHSICFALCIFRCRI